MSPFAAVYDHIQKIIKKTKKWRTHTHTHTQDNTIQK